MYACMPWPSCLVCADNSRCFSCWQTDRQWQTDSVTLADSAWAVSIWALRQCRVTQICQTLSDSVSAASCMQADRCLAAWEAESLRLWVWVCHSLRLWKAVQAYLLSKCQVLCSACVPDCVRQQPVCLWGYRIEVHLPKPAHFTFCTVNSLAHVQHWTPTSGARWETDLCVTIFLGKSNLLYLRWVGK
jgi:hypothetical protein